MAGASCCLNTGDRRYHRSSDNGAEKCSVKYGCGDPGGEGVNDNNLKEKCTVKYGCGGQEGEGFMITT